MHPRRDDAPGAWWLITNRGLAKRAVFETREDVERFYAALERVVDAELLIVDAFSLLTTHFHLLVESPRGEISQAMKLVTNEFVRWFNRARKRDGSLFAGRFDGRPIRDAVHWEACLRYIDLNAVRARMCGTPSEHPYGSARGYRFGLAPAWLRQERVRTVVTNALGLAEYESARYDEYACAVDPAANAYLVGRNTECVEFSHRAWISTVTQSVRGAVSAWSWHWFVAASSLGVRW